MRIAVIGETGQLARCLAQGGSPHECTFAGRAAIDLAQPQTIAPALDAAGPDLVVNAAAYTAVDRAESEPELAMAVNCAGPAAIARWCAANARPLIHVSTDYVYDGMKSGPYVEDDPVAPLGVYGATKLAGEVAVRAALPGAVILRTAWVYSAFGSNFVKTMLRVGAQRDVLGVVDDQHGCPTSAHDLATAIAAIAPRVAADPAVAGVYHYAGAGTISWADFAEAIFADADLGKPAPRIDRIPTREYPTPAARPKNSVLDCAKFERVFREPMQPWRDALAVVLAELRQEGRKA